ncbi:DgyrCDS3688 [Dimorphilus gyrociliatus]|uniref:DgyrCDS3688 n=1 Tax=Dimorphilus gyrociliatus TaxID=2664684 RepID=A0A7I8VG44_9ANNE|nr:DgyrCDS3688 [Dimorphilus gyrociliatus]
MAATTKGSIYNIILYGFLILSLVYGPLVHVLISIEDHHEVLQYKFKNSTESKRIVVNESVAKSSHPSSICIITRFHQVGPFITAAICFGIIGILAGTIISSRNRQKIVLLDKLRIQLVIILQTLILANIIYLIAVCIHYMYKYDYTTGRYSLCPENKKRGVKRYYNILLFIGAFSVISCIYFLILSIMEYLKGERNSFCSLSCPLEICRKKPTPVETSHSIHIYHLSQSHMPIPSQTRDTTTSTARREDQNDDPPPYDSIPPSYESCIRNKDNSQPLTDSVNSYLADEQKESSL